MIDRDKDNDLTPCARKSCRHIGAPHPVNGIRDDCTVMSTRTMGRSLAWLRTEPVPAHEPQNPRPGGPGALVPQARPDLAIAFAVEPALGDHCPGLPPTNCASGIGPCGPGRSRGRGSAGAGWKSR